MDNYHISLLRYQFTPCTKGIIIDDMSAIAYTIEPPHGHPRLISVGSHEVVLFYSTHFKQTVLRVIDSHLKDNYIEIHPGNKVTDTDGCIIPGDQPSLLDNCVWNSRATIARVMPKYYSLLLNNCKLYLDVYNWVSPIIPAVS